MQKGQNHSTEDEDGKDDFVVLFNHIIQILDLAVNVMLCIPNYGVHVSFMRKGL